MLAKGQNVMLKRTIYHHVRDKGIPKGTLGKILGVRHLPIDPEQLCLVKFKGFGWPRSTECSNLRPDRGEGK